MTMEFVHDRFQITLEPQALPNFFFTLTIEDKRDFRIYKGEFDMHVVTDDIASFEALMKKFFDGKYYFRVEPYADGLELTFKITIDDIVLKQFKLQLPLFHKLTEKEEHAARILQLENKVEVMQKQLDRLNLFMESYQGDPDTIYEICFYTRYTPHNGHIKKFAQFAKRSVEIIAIDFDKKNFCYVGGGQLPDEIYKKEYGKISIQLGNFTWLQEFELLNYNYEVFSEVNFDFSAAYSNSLKRFKVTNCPKLKRIDIPAYWWNTKTLILDNCPDVDLEYFFDGTKRCITTIILVDKPSRLMERYSRRLEEIGICLMF